MAKWFKRKDGKLSVEYIAIMILALAVLLILLLYSGTIKDKIVDGVAIFFDRLKGR
ncbi:MAG: hypothetical protein U9Q69_06365 [Nanoarchaeota archaeon]|nr:hypothetical protein [Nanoarchaeota archaeon]